MRRKMSALVLFPTIESVLPAIAEHFPQLVRDGWKEKLKAGGPSKVVEAMVAAGELPEGPAAPGALSAALRGLSAAGHRPRPPRMTGNRPRGKEFP